MSTDLPFLPLPPVPERQSPKDGMIPKRRGIQGKNNLSRPVSEHLSQKILQENAPVDIPATYTAKPLPPTPAFIPFLPGPSTKMAPPELPPKDYLSRSELMEAPSVFRKPEHFAVFSDVFGVKEADGKIVNIEEVTTIYLRLVKFARASGTTPDVMVKNLKRGKEVALEIGSPDFRSSQKEYPASDLVALDWFFKSQQAKLKQLYLKGTTKLSDPEHLLPQFLLQVRGMNEGQEANKLGPYSRPSSHRPEENNNVKNSIIYCQNGSCICFSKENWESLLANRDYETKDIHFFDLTALGIDASGEGLSPPGENSRTYLFHLVSEFDEVTQTKQSVFEYKTESHGLAPITLDNTWGKPTELALDKIAHGINIYKKFTVPDPNAPFSSLKEDKLPPKISKLMNDLKILKGEQGSPLRKSYEELQLTARRKNDYGLPELRTHLMNQRSVAELTSTQKNQVEAVLLEIERVYQKSRELQEGSEHVLLPRGQEVILPTIQEMLENKVKFIP